MTNRYDWDGIRDRFESGETSGASHPEYRRNQVMPSLFEQIGTSFGPGVLG